MKVPLVFLSLFATHLLNSKAEAFSPSHPPRPAHDFCSTCHDYPQLDEYARGIISGEPSTLFEELGLYYIGPVDGHNVEDLVAILSEVKKTETVGPVIIHVVTEKVKGAGIV